MEKGSSKLVLLTLLLGLGTTVYFLLSTIAFYLLEPIEARLIYIALSFVSLLLPLIKKQERYLPFAYILPVTLWTLIYFYSRLNLVFQVDALPVYYFDVYLEAYRASERIYIYESRGEYIGYYIVSYIIGLVDAWNYRALIVSVVSLHLFLLFLTAYIYFRALRRTSTFTVAYIFSLVFVIFSLLINYIWLFSGSRFYSSIFFLMFFYLILKYGIDFPGKSLAATLLLFNLGVSVTDFGVSILMVAFSFAYSIIKKNLKVLLFSLPPILHALYMTSMVYLYNVQDEVTKAIEMWIKTVIGEAPLERGFSIHFETAPIYEKVGEVVFWVSYLIVLGVVAMYQLRILFNKKARKSTSTTVRILQVMFLVFYSSWMFMYFANRIATLQTDIGIISLVFAQILLPPTMIPISIRIQQGLASKRKKSSQFLGKRTLTTCFLALVLISSMLNVYTWSYPKSARDPVKSVDDWDNRHQTEVYAVYQLIHKHRGIASYTFLVSDVARVVYGQRLTYIDNMKWIHYVPYDNPALFSKVLRDAISYSEFLLVAVPNLMIFDDVTRISNVVFSTSSEVLVIPTSMTRQYAASQDVRA